LERWAVARKRDGNFTVLKVEVAFIERHGGYLLRRGRIVQFVAQNKIHLFETEQQAEAVVRYLTAG